VLGAGGCAGGCAGGFGGRLLGASGNVEDDWDVGFELDDCGCGDCVRLRCLLELAGGRE
jgi:hypothetical protein